MQLHSCKVGEQFHLQWVLKHTQKGWKVWAGPHRDRVNILTLSWSKVSPPHTPATVPSLEEAMSVKPFSLLLMSPGRSLRKDLDIVLNREGLILRQELMGNIWKRGRKIILRDWNSSPVTSLQSRALPAGITSHKTAWPQMGPEPKSGYPKG